MEKKYLMIEIYNTPMMAVAAIPNQVLFAKSTFFFLCLYFLFNYFFLFEKSTQLRCNLLEATPNIFKSHQINACVFTQF